MCGKLRQILIHSIFIFQLEPLSLKSLMKVLSQTEILKIRCMLLLSIIIDFFLMKLNIFLPSQDNWMQFPILKVSKKVSRQDIGTRLL